MTIYYVGIGGNDGNSGTSWANRKLTLNGAEDIPVVAGDTVYVGPGTYREQLTVDVAGSSGNLISYIGDPSGELTDGVGGVVRVTGSDNDQTATRGNCVACGSGENYRLFQNFLFDSTASVIVSMNSSGVGSVFRDCVFQGAGSDAISINSSTQDAMTIERCFFLGNEGSAILFTNGADITATHTVQNCVIFGQAFNYGVYTNNVDGITIKNIYVTGCERGVRTNSLTGSITVNNSLFQGCRYTLYAGASGEITEDYNNIDASSTDRVNTTAGTNSQTYHTNISLPLLLAGIRYPWEFGLAGWSALAAITGTSEPTDDFRGITRPTTASKKSWGPYQMFRVERETTTTYDTSAASMKLSDASAYQIFVPVANESTTISVRVNREANYAGTNPQMIIKQPGQSDRTTTDAGSSGSFNELTDTFTPAASPPYVVVELRSNNTATSGSYAVYFDSLAVS